MKKNEFINATEHLGYTVLFGDGDQDIQLQLDVINRFIDEKVNALVIAPVSYDEISPAVVKANQAAIPAICLGG